MKRIGIFSGTFNPVHAGHIGFALQSLTQAKLDKVYLMPERYREGKSDVAHFAHRVAMVRQAIRPHRQLGLIESSDVSFSVNKTLVKLRNQFYGYRLVFLVGSDSLKTMGSWPGVENLLKTSELVVGIRKADEADVATWVQALPVNPRQLTLIPSHAPAVSSTKIREALRRSETAEGTLSSVRRYSDRNWLYVSLT
jgi:nicotinate-nucleotide adenylyltransferase